MRNRSSGLLNLLHGALFVVDDTLGDVFSWYDPQARRGVTLNLKASSGGYQSSGAGHAAMHAYWQPTEFVKVKQ